MTNKPNMKLSAGSIKLSAWNNIGRDKQGKETEFTTLTIERVYKDKQGNWQSTNIFRPQDLPKVRILIDEAYKLITMTEQEV